MVGKLLKSINPVRLVNKVRFRARAPQGLQSVLEIPHWDQSAEPQVFHFGDHVAAARTPADKLHSFVVACAYPHDTPKRRGDGNTWKFYKGENWKKLRKKLPRRGLGIKSETPVAGDPHFVHVELQPHPELLKYLQDYKPPAKYKWTQPFSYP